MKAYISVLNDVICLSEIKKISIVYDNGTNYGNQWIQSLFVTYKDGKTEEYITTDRAKAKQDYENLKSALLEIETAHPTEKGGEGVMAELVEVTRCKDCQYWQDKNSKGTQGICLCGEKDMNYGGEFYPFANDFCSYGEPHTPKERGGEK